MIADRCPTCDRDACPWWATRKGITCPVACGLLGCAHVSTIAQNNADDCARHAVDWRARCLASEDAAATFRGAARAEIDRLNVELHEATRRLSEEKATVAAQSLDLFGAIDAQDKAERRLAAVEEAVEAARKQLATLVDHFDAMDGEEDSTLLATDLQAISDGLRAALEKP